MQKPKILWLSTGGTFACENTENGLRPEDGDKFSAKVLAYLGDAAAKYDITPKNIMNKDSTNITPDDWQTIADSINGALSAYNGIVVTHGTDTMSFTAAALSVMLRNPPVPVVLTGSQKRFFAENSDAPRNFLDALAVAADSRFNTVCAVFCGRIFGGLDMYKSDSADFDAFSAHDAPIGTVNGGVPVPTGNTDIGGTYTYSPALCKKVAVIKITPAADPVMIRGILQSGIKGVVAECYGAGGIPDFLLDEFRAAAEKGIKITAVSGCVHGGADLGIYEVGKNAQSAGIQSGGKMGVEAALAVMMHELMTVDS